MRTAHLKRPHFVQGRLSQTQHTCSATHGDTQVAPLSASCHARAVERHQAAFLYTVAYIGIPHPFTLHCASQGTGQQRHPAAKCILTALRCFDPLALQNSQRHIEQPSGAMAPGAQRAAFATRLVAAKTGSATSATRRPRPRSAAARPAPCPCSRRRRRSRACRA